MFHVIKSISRDHLQTRKTTHARNMIPDMHRTAEIINARESGAKEVTPWCGTVYALHDKQQLSQLYHVSVESHSFVRVTTTTSYWQLIYTPLNLTGYTLVD
jgi:hypothetical protein